MGTLGSVKLIKKLPSPIQQFKFIQDQIKRELVPVAKEYVDERHRIVSNFETDIKFGYRVSVSQAQVTLTILVENSEQQLENSDWTVGDLWRALDSKGTEAHDIPKTRPGPLRFQWGGPGSYEPKTRPIAQFGGPGTVTSGETVVRKKVKHPGFRPRKFSQVINKKLRKRYDKAIDRGFRLGARKRR